MIYACDLEVARNFTEILNVPVEKFVYGNIDIAREFWIHQNEIRPGVEAIPWVAFYRMIEFGEEVRVCHSTQIIDNTGDGNHIDFKFIPAIFNYTIEYISDKVTDQVEAIRKYFFKSGSQPMFEVSDIYGNSWQLKAVFENPDDTSDLESQPDSGRLVRTTFEVRVEAFIAEKVGTFAPIDEILLRMYQLHDLSDISDIIKCEEM